MFEIGDLLLGANIFHSRSWYLSTKLHDITYKKNII